MLLILYDDACASLSLGNTVLARWIIWYCIPNPHWNGVYRFIKLVLANVLISYLIVCRTTVWRWCQRGIMKLTYVGRQYCSHLTYRFFNDCLLQKSLGRELDLPKICNWNLLLHNQVNAALKFIELNMKKKSIHQICSTFLVI